MSDGTTLDTTAKLTAGVECVTYDAKTKIATFTTTDSSWACRVYVHQKDDGIYSVASYGKS